jgi:hypothetical protein
MGAGGYLGIQFTAPIASVPTMVMTLAIADCVHILGATRRGLRAGLTKREAVRASLKLNMVPVVITGATTAIGFLSFNFSEVPPFRDLGNMTAIGILVAALLSLSLLPALMLLLPFRQSDSEGDGALLAAPLHRLGELVARRHRAVVVVSMLVAATVTALASRNVIEDEMLAYRHPRITVREDTDHLSRRLGGIYTLEYSVPSGRSGGIADPGYLAVLRDFRTWLESQPGVVHVMAMDQVLGRIRRAAHGGADTADTLPTRPDEAAQYLLMYEMSLPYGLDLNNMINVDKSSTRVIATVDNLPSTQLIALTEAGERWLEPRVPGGSNVRGISMPLIFAHLAHRQVESMLTGTVWSILLIAGLIMATLRSMRYGLAALAAITLPIAVAFGVWALFKGQLTAGLALVAGMSLGIIDDDAVHVINKFRHALEDGLAPAEALPHVMKTAGWDMLVTSSALIAGFLTLAQSSFGLFFDLAKMTAITLVVALVFNLVVLPALLVLASTRRRVLQPALAAGLVLLIAGGMASSASAEDAQAAAKGLEIAREADRRDTGWKSAEVEVRMVLRNSHGETSERFLRSAWMETTGDGDRGLVVFDRPADVKGTAALTFSHKVGDDDRWLYLPALRRVKRIASSNKSGPFMGSEFAYEDLASQEVEKFAYRYVREDVLDGVASWVVERDPIDPRSGYLRQLVWYGKTDYRPLKVEYFDRKNELLKVLTYERYEKYGAFWRARQQRMSNSQTGKSTLIEFGPFRFDRGLTADDFTPERLGSVQ